MSAICEIMNINKCFRIFVNASHSIFLKDHWNTNEIKTKSFFENRGHNFLENAMILKSAKSKTMLVKLELLKVLFGTVN